MGNGQPVWSLKPAVAVAMVAVVWLASTWLFWVGYVGSDDLFYARYAFLLHRPPTNWWEFRIIPVLAMRASFALFGATELAAALPNLVLSIIFLACAGWMIGWPARNTWYKQAGMMLAPLVPMEATFRSVPVASYFGGAVFCIGAALFLGPFDREPTPWQRSLGAVLLGLAFTCHEMMLFPIGILCLVSLALNWRKHWKPVAICITVAALSLIIEGIVYGKLLGDPLARFHIAAVGAATSKPGVDPDAGISGLRFYLWPFELLTFRKPFAGSLVILMAAGLLSWRKLNETQRILYLMTFGTWFWFGWGSTVPYAYRPVFRQAHYYGPLMLAVVTLLPFTLANVWERRPRIGLAVLGLLAVAFVVANATGGRWGQNVAVSKKLLEYSLQHPELTFVTNADTMNEMYALNGFKIPRNVICLNGPGVSGKLLLNKEPRQWPRYQFPVVDANAVLLNFEAAHLRGFEPEFQAFVDQHPGRIVQILPAQTKWFFEPTAAVTGQRSFMIRNLGASAVLLPGGVSTAPTP